MRLGGSTMLINPNRVEIDYGYTYMAIATNATCSI